MPTEKDGVPVFNLSAAGHPAGSLEIDTRLRPDPKIKAERQVPANYYPLIAATIRALPPGAGRNDRRTVYECARTVLLQQRPDPERCDALGWRSLGSG